jgi:hypothetical protein
MLQLLLLLLVYDNSCHCYEVHVGLCGVRLIAGAVYSLACAPNANEM